MTFAGFVQYKTRHVSPVMKRGMTNINEDAKVSPKRSQLMSLST